MVGWLIGSINYMKKHITLVSKIFAYIGLVFGIAFGILYLKLIIPSERELWRITANDISDPTIVNNLLLFVGGRNPDYMSECAYIYAVDKNTGEPLWSSESLTKAYCARSSGPVHTGIIPAPGNKDMIFVESSYWRTDDELENVLYALSSLEGKLLWEAEGYTGYYPSDDPEINTNYFYAVNTEGWLAAIDAITGNHIWKQGLPQAEDYGAIEYYDQVLYYDDSDNRSLITFDARDGNQLWKVSDLDYVGQIMFSDHLVYLPTSSYHDGGTKYPTVGNPPFYITALDTRTGGQKWKISIGGIFSPQSRIIGNKIYIRTHSQTGSFDDARSLSSLVVVDKDTGELIWQFNEDHLHGDINYIVQDSVVYVGADDGYQFALDDETGNIIWQTKAPGFSYYLHVEDDTLVVVYNENYAAGFDSKTGSQKWLLDIGMDVSKYSGDLIFTDDGVIYISSAVKRKIYAIDIGTGKILWSWNHSYMIQALDNDILYVDQYRPFMGYDWFFALKTRP